MEDRSLPEGLIARPPTLEDAGQVAAVIAACQEAEGDPAEMSEAELLSDWAGINLAQDAVTVTAPTGQIVAHADVLTRRNVQVSVYGYVHPLYRQKGIGTFLVRWGEELASERMQHAPSSARITVDHFIRETNGTARRLMEEQGYAPVRTYYWMAIDLHQPTPAPTYPEGIVIRPFVPGQDDQALYEVGEAAFRDIWRRPPGTRERWLEGTHFPDFDPRLWLLAVDRAQGEVVGFSLGKLVAGKGNVASLGVRRPWRRHGVGLALLQHTFREFFQRDVPEVGLSVDAESSTGAPKLYLAAGMHVTKSYVRCEKILRPGEELVMLDS